MLLPFEKFGTWNRRTPSDPNPPMGSTASSHVFQLNAWSTCCNTRRNERTPNIISLDDFGQRQLAPDARHCIEKAAKRKPGSCATTNSNGLIATGRAPDLTISSSNVYDDSAGRTRSHRKTLRTTTGLKTSLDPMPRADRRRSVAVESPQTGQEIIETFTNNLKEDYYVGSASGVAVAQLQKHQPFNFLDPANHAVDCRRCPRCYIYNVGQRVWRGTSAAARRWVIPACPEGPALLRARRSADVLYLE